MAENGSTRRERFYQPTGIGNGGPWDALINVRVTQVGYAPFPRPSYFAGGVSWLPLATTHIATWLRSGPRPVFVALQSQADYQPGLGDTWRANLVAVDETGAEIGTWNLADDFSGPRAFCHAGIPWQLEHDWAFAELHGRLFMSTQGRTFLLTFGREPQNNVYPGVSGDISVSQPQAADLRFYEVAWRQGVAATALPYMTERFGSELMVAHNDALFFAGMRQGTQIRMDRSFTAYEVELLQAAGLALVQDETVLTVGERTLVWTDAQDPFAVALPAFREVLCRSPITALCSWNGKLFVFTRDETWVMTGATEKEYALRRISDGVGAQHGKAVVATPAGVVFGADTGLYATDGETVTKISSALDHLWGRPLPDTQKTRDPAGWWAVAERAGLMRLTQRWGRLMWNERAQELWAPVATEGSGKQFGAAVVLNMPLKAWTLWTPPQGTTGSPARPVLQYSVEWLAEHRGQTVLVGRQDGVMTRWCEDGSVGTTIAEATPSGYRDSDAVFVSRPLMIEPGGKYRFSGVELSFTGDMLGEAVLVSMEAMPHATGAVVDQEGDVAQFAIAAPPWQKYKQPGWDAVGKTWGNAGWMIQGGVQKQFLESTIHSAVAWLFLLAQPGAWELLGVELAYQQSYSNPRG